MCTKYVSNFVRGPNCMCWVLLQDSEITHVSDTIDLSTMPVEDSYTGPCMIGRLFESCLLKRCGSMRCA